MVLVTSLTLSYYAATVATAIFYLGVSVVSTDGLPWMNCDPSLKYKGASDTDCTDTLPWMNCEPGFEYRGIVCKSYSELGMTNRSLDVVVINAAEEYYQ